MYMQNTQDFERFTKARERLTVLSLASITLRWNVEVKKWTAKLRDTVQILNGDLAILSCNLWINRGLPAPYEHSLKMQSRWRIICENIHMISTSNLLSNDHHYCFKPDTQAVVTSHWLRAQGMFHNVNYQIWTHDSYNFNLSELLHGSSESLMNYLT